MPGTLIVAFALRQPLPEKRPMRSPIVCVRLSREAWNRYSAEAQAHRLGLATYVRQRLEQQDRVVAELALRAAGELGVAEEEPSASTSPPTDSGTLVEVLLILRSIAGPQKSAVAQKEVERRGLASWK
jgi:hypothetical protein